MIKHIVMFKFSENAKGKSKNKKLMRKIKNHPA